jgi:two-component sensor histidine kinase
MARTPVLLTIDDNAAGRYFKTRILREAGYVALEAETGEEGLAVTGSKRPDLVLLDVNLPDINGVEVCELIKERFAGTLVLEMSAVYTELEDRVRGLQRGADAFLVEPVEPQELLATVQALLRLRQAEQELRLALQRNEFLLGELRHRTKNSMAVIQSIARQTLRDAPGPLVAAFTTRIQALASAYDSLSEEDWLGANLEDLARRQLAVVEGRVTMAGPGIAVPPTLAMSLSLVLHELLTNATKYGALSVPQGVVDLSWEVAGDDAPQRVFLTWKERGGPRVTPPDRTGFGSTFIERGLPRATVERRFEPEGVVCTIDLPLS